MTHSYVPWPIHVWRDSFVCGMTTCGVACRETVDLSCNCTSLCDVTCHDSFTCDVTYWYAVWLMNMWHGSCICDMTHLCVTWLIHMRYGSWICGVVCWFICGMTHAYVIGLIHMSHYLCVCDITYSYMTLLIHISHYLFIRYMTHLYAAAFACDVTHSYAERQAMWWLRWVGSLKWSVSFAEYSLFYRSLLQKRPIILRSLLIIATP